MLKILDVRVDDLNLEEILDKVKKAVDSSNKMQIITLNTEMIMKTQSDNNFKNVINSAGLVVPESSGVVIAATYQADNSSLSIVKLIRSGIKTVFSRNDPQHIERIPGIDLVTSLAGLCEEFGFHLTLLGGHIGVAEKAAANLKSKFNKLNVNAIYGGDLGKDDVNILQEVKNTRTDILLVAFGHGKQEKWIAENLGKIDAKVAVGVGGSFDFLAGEVKRAPEWLRKAGLEWTFRLFVQPWRIKRQLQLFKFLSLLSKS